MALTAEQRSAAARKANETRRMGREAGGVHHREGGRRDVKTVLEANARDTVFRILKGLSESSRVRVIGAVEALLG